jgi:hypothetical protein
MFKNKSIFMALLRKNYLNIKNHQKQMGVFICLIVFLGLQLCLVSPIKAAGSLWNSQLGTGEIGNSFGVSNGTPVSATDLVVQVIRYLLTFLGLLMTVIIIWAGWRWMTAGGDEKKVETAKSHLLSAVIGGVIIIAAYVIMYLVEETARKMITGSIW